MTTLGTNHATCYAFQRVDIERGVPKLVFCEQVRTQHARMEQQ